MRKFSPLGYGLWLLLLPTSLYANDVSKRVHLMKYSIKMEAALPHETKWEVSWLDQLKIIEEAYAYKEGESCLILGFKSQYKNGKCRIADAEDIKDYKSQCQGNSLPCNPQVFGKPSAEKPFCVTPGVKELSKACAKEAFSHVAKNSKAPELQAVPSMSLQKFDLDKIEMGSMSSELSSGLSALFKHDDSSLEAAIKFTESLCEDLKLSTKSGHQPLDNKICQAQLSFLKKGLGTTEQPKLETEDDASHLTANVTPPIDLKLTQEDKPKEEVSVVQPEVCVDPILEEKTEENIKDVQKVTEPSPASALMTCVNKIEAHKIVATQNEGISGYNRERKRDLGYWHQLDGEKQFGRMCENLSTDEVATFTFVSPGGFSTVNVKAANIKNQISRVSSKGKEYYLVRDMFGDYFELVAKEKLNSAPQATQEEIRRYLRTVGGVDNVVPVPAEKQEEAKACIRERLDEYLDWITYPTGILPTPKEYNADVAIYNASISSGKPGEELKPKYSKTVDEIKKELFEKAMTDVPDCKGILNEEIFSKQFDKDHADRIRLYNQFRTILNLDKK